MKYFINYLLVLLFMTSCSTMRINSYAYMDDIYYNGQITENETETLTPAIIYPISEPTISKPYVYTPYTSIYNNNYYNDEYYNPYVYFDTPFNNGYPYIFWMSLDYYFPPNYGVCVIPPVVVQPEPVVKTKRFSWDYKPTYRTNKTVTETQKINNTTIRNSSTSKPTYQNRTSTQNKSGSSTVTRSNTTKKSTYTGKRIK